MAFCPNCGTQAGSAAFCPNCGTSLGQSGPRAASSLTGSAGIRTNLASALCYAIPFICGIIFLVLEPYSKDRSVRFHAFQALFFWLAWILVGTALRLLAFPIFVFAYPIYQILVLVIWVYLIISAYQGKRVMLPVIGDLAAKQV
jgi:uncharacterized membrane protein